MKRGLEKTMCVEVEEVATKNAGTRGVTLGVPVACVEERVRETVRNDSPLGEVLEFFPKAVESNAEFLRSIPDAAFTVHHICTTPCEEGGEKVAVRWIMEGHHIGFGILNHLGAPTGKRVQIMGITHFHYKNGKIVDEWRVYDEASALVQIKLAQMADVTAARLAPDA